MKDGLKFAAAVAVFIILALVFFVLKFGVNPRPISYMDPSGFDSPRELGKGAYQALWKTLRDRDVVAFGFDHADLELQEIWEGFKQAQAEDTSASVKPVLLDSFPERYPTTFTWIHQGDIESFHGGKDPLIKAAQDRWMRAITTVIFARAKAIDSDCGIEVGSVESYRNLECLKILGSRQIAWSKRVPTNKFRAVVNQPGMADFILVFTPPQAP